MYVVIPIHRTLVLKQNRSGELADVDLYYDHPGGRNLNIIASEDDVLWDNERNNGSTYYYHPSTQKCNVIQMPVGILKPDWLKGAKYEGVEEVNGHQVCWKDTYKCPLCRCGVWIYYIYLQMFYIFDRCICKYT